jgi:aminodeoxyfutalosine synthase
VLLNAFRDPFLADVAAKVEAGERLSLEEGVRLFQTDDLVGLGRLADFERRRRHGNAAYFNVNRHLNYTNVCYWDCTFAATSARNGSRKAFKSTSP